jgi:hypothetical protein
VKHASVVLKLTTALALGAVILLGAFSLTAPVNAAGCEPVVCPAIALICPQGQVACRPSPCNCALACAPEGHGCNS